MESMTARGIYYALEKPRGSMLDKFPPVADVLQRTNATKVSVTLFAFGHASLKPLTVWGTAPWLPKLEEVAKDRLSKMQRAGLFPSETLASVAEDGSVQWP